MYSPDVCPQVYAPQVCALQVCALPVCMFQVHIPTDVHPLGVHSLGGCTLQGCRGFLQDTELPLHPQGGCESVNVTWAASHGGTVGTWNQRDLPLTGSQIRGKHFSALSLSFLVCKSGIVPAETGW